MPSMRPIALTVLGQTNRELAAVSKAGAFRDDAAAMQLHNRAHQSEADTET